MTMNPDARARLAAASRRYLAAEPWRCVGDDYLFGVHDRTAGRFGCAAVMGAGGMEFGLDVKLGAEGFALSEKVHAEELDHSTVMAKASGLAMSVTDAAPASRAFTRLRPFAIDPEKKVRVGAKRGYLTGFRLVPGQHPRPVDSEEGLVLSRFLEAVAELAEQGRLGKDAPRDGDRWLFFNLTEEEGRLATRQSYRRLAEVNVQHSPVALAPELLARLKGRPRLDGRYYLSVFCPPATVGGGIIWTALLLDEAGRPIFTESSHGFGDAALAALGAFEGKRRVVAGAPEISVPREIWTDSFPVYEAIKDALLALEVRLLCKEGVPELERAKASLSEFLTGA